MARSRTGQLIFSGGRFRARVTLPGGRRMVNLATSNPAVARRRLAGLLNGGEPQAFGPHEAFEAAARRIIEEQRAEGLVAWQDRQRRLERHAFPILGGVRVDAVRAAQVRAALEHCVAAGFSAQTVIHLRNDLSSIFRRLWQDEEIQENPVARVRTPQGTQDRRARAILTDDEVVAFVFCEHVSLELRVMAASARALGGLRTSDLHAWRWEDVDLVGWSKVRAPRPKTDRATFLALPDELTPILRRWWQAEGAPERGPVFPVRRGANAGGHRGHQSYAKALRAGLLAASIRRAALHEATDDSLPVDFHSFRRAFCTAAAVLPTSQAMALTGHKKVGTHLGYVDRLHLQLPAAVLPGFRSDPDANSAPVRIST